MGNLVERWPIPTPLPVGAVNAYRIEGSRAALIDSGPRLSDALQAVRERLRERPVRILLLTHEHSDHAGLARTLQRDEGVEVWIHHRESPVLARWNEDAAAREADYEKGLQRAGVPRRLGEHMRHGGRKYDSWSESVSADRTFGHGERLGLGGREFEVVDAPGHTPGSFLLTDGRDTFSGDTLLETITPNALSVREQERGGLAEYLRTLRQLQGREWGRVLPGHGNSFSNAHEVIRRGLLHAERRRERVQRELGAGPATPWQVVERLFPRLPDDQAFLATSEVLGHLEALRLDGHVHVERSGGVDRYEANA